MNTNQKWEMLLIIILFSTISACVEKSKEKPQEEENITTAPSGIISLNEAKILCDNYEDRRIPSIINFELAQNESKEKFIPTQFIDFDFKTIKKYIKYVEQQARKANVKPDSLRIYLGNYGMDGKDPNHNTVFVLPTATIDGENGGFYIGANGKAKLIRNYWPKNSNDEQNMEQKSEAGFLPSLNMSLYQEESLILNYGNGGPPPNNDF